MLARGLLNSSTVAHGTCRHKAVCRPVAAPAVAISPRRVGNVSRLRTVCCFATHYATALLPDSDVQELDAGFPVGQYDTGMGEKLVIENGEDRTRLVTKLVIVDKITENKKKLATALREYEQNVGFGVGDAQRWAARKALMLAMAMQESNHMDVRQRDDTKDWDAPGRLSKAANCSIFNLSVDFVEKSRYYHNPGNFNEFVLLTTEKFDFLNRDEGLLEAIGILESAFAKWGPSVESTLAFVRQGGSGFDPDKGGSWRQQHHFEGVAGRDVSESNAVIFNIVQYLRCIKRSVRYIEEHPEVWSNADRPDIILKHI